MCEHIGLISLLIKLSFSVFFISLFLLIFNQSKDYKGSIVGELSGPLAPVFDKNYVKTNVQWIRYLLGTSFFTITCLYVLKVNISC